MSDDLSEELRALYREAISGGRFGPSPTDFQQSLNAAWKIVNALPSLLAERDALREALETIRIASEFHAQDGVSDHTMRYAHESTKRLCDKALQDKVVGNQSEGLSELQALGQEIENE